jgi:Bacterial Ig-like domain (group 3)
MLLRRTPVVHFRPVPRPHSLPIAGKNRYTITRCFYAALGLILAFRFVPAALAQQTIHVPADQPTIQAGINAANNGDIVLVSPGTYYENIDFLGKAITVSSSAGPATTVIDGGSKTGLAVVAFRSQELRTSIISGFTIQHGGTQTATSQASGGVFVYNAAPTIQNNVVVANRCGGIFAADGGALIQGNTITGTLYQNGGSGPNDAFCQQGGTGIVVEGTVTVGPYTHVEIIGNTITNNTQALGAGGIAIEAAESTLIQNNIISNNTGMSAGGIGTSNTQAVFIIQNVIYANTVTRGSNGTAGGIAISSPQYGSSTPPQALIAQNTFGGNTLLTGASGESATELNLSGAVSEYIVANNIFAGGSSSVPTVNCSVAYSSLAPTPVTFENNDVFNSNGSGYGGACSNQTGSGGNISANPLLVTPGTDFHLVLSSPAVDSGDNGLVSLPATDLDGNPRIRDATHKGYPVVDMGVYEYPGLLDGTPFSTTLTSSLNPLPYGESVTFSVTVTATSSGAATPTGNIAFTDGATVLSSQPLQSVGATTASAQFTTASLAAGSHSITATYNTRTGSSVSSASLTQVVTGIATTATLSSSLNPAPYGQTVTLTASVSGSTGSGTPTGTIRFMDGASVLATQQLAPSGALTSSAAFASSTLSAGGHNLSAVYDGSGAFAPSSASLTENIIGISSTTTTLSGSPNPSYLGKPVTFLVTVTSTLPGAASPTGAVTLTVGGTTVLGTQTLVPAGSNTSQANFSVNNLPLGGQPILASYNPTGNFLGSTAAITESVLLPPDFTITLANPTITLQTQHHTTTTVTLTSLNALADTITLACANPPAYITCKFTPGPAPLVANGTTTVSLYVDTDSVLGYVLNHPAPAPRNSPTLPLNFALLLSPVGLLAGLIVFPKRTLGTRNLLHLLALTLAVLPLALTLTGCTTIELPYSAPPSAAPGTYTLPITATGTTTGNSHTAQVTLTVTP